MNIDLREMERQAEEIRAQMRDVLTRKLGKPRKVDKTLDELLRQMTRRHKFSVNLKIMPHILRQFRDWRVRLNLFVLFIKFASLFYMDLDIQNT